MINKSIASEIELVLSKVKSRAVKSTLVLELHKPAVERTGFFICGNHYLKISDQQFYFPGAMKSVCYNLLLKYEFIASKFKTQSRVQLLVK